MTTPTQDPVASEAWTGSTTGRRVDGIDVRDSVQRSCTPSEGDGAFRSVRAALTTS